MCLTPFSHIHVCCSSQRLSSRIVSLFTDWPLAVDERFGTFFALLLTLLLETAFAQKTQPSSPPTSSSAVESKTGGSREASETQGNPDIRVWVNTKSGVYHFPATH
jgi:hypothetical protein